MAPDVLVLRNAMDSATRTHIGIVSDPDTDDSDRAERGSESETKSTDPDELVELAYENSEFDQIMPGGYKLYEVGESCATSVTADHLEAPER